MAAPRQRQEHWRQWRLNRGRGKREEGRDAELRELVKGKTLRLQCLQLVGQLHSVRSVTKLATGHTSARMKEFTYRDLLGPSSLKTPN